MSSGLKIIVSGMVAADPYHGGATWAVLQYVLGLRSLGHDVYLIEPIPPGSIRPESASLQCSTNAQYFHSVTAEFGLAGSASLLLEGSRTTTGMSYDALLETAAECDVLINISGMLTDTRLLERIPSRVYLDLDPAFNQMWAAVDGIDMRFAAHTHFVTVGLAIGTPECAVPTCGREWQHTLQPVVLSEWPIASHHSADAWTTVGNWRGYGSIRHNGVLFGQKAHSFRRFMDLPRRTSARLRPAIGIHPGEVTDRQALDSNEWALTNPNEVAATPDAYRTFVQHSKGELGIAKSGYVESQCGWFSDRSICYLASGRPVVAQETGFSSYLPVGEGLLSFITSEDAVEALTAAEADYHTHCHRARELAEEHFRADRVLTRLLDIVGTA